MDKLVFRIIKIAGKDKKSLLLSILVSFFESTTVFVPYMLVFFSVNKYINDTLTLKDIEIISIIMFISIVLRAVFRRIIDGLQSTKGLDIFARQRIKLVNHLRKLPMGYFSEDNMGNIISVLTTDLIFAEEVAMSFFGQLINSYISILLSILVMLYINIQIGLIYIVIMIISYFAIKYLDKINKKYGKVRQDQFGNLSNEVVEYIKGIPTIKAFSMAEDEENIIDIFEEVKEKSLTFERKYFLPRILTESSYTIGTGILIFASVLLYFYGYITKDLAIGMLIFSSVSLSAIVVIINGTTRFGILEAGLNRFDKLMEEKELIDTENDIKLTNFDIEFKDVCFAYENNDVINNMSFKIKENTLNALVGSSGSGKSTITNLIARFWDIDRGQITIGGKNIKDISLDTLLSNISMVFQNVYLFQDTIFNNIAFGLENASKEEVINAAKKARCHDFIMKLEDGYDTVIGQGGATLSGGEKQRISIARAILKDAPIILLDEATSSIDPENEIYIQEAINELVKNKTLIVIAHRLSSIVEADNIFVVENGKLVEQGNHKKLIQYNGVYNKMYSFYA
ncbi:MAG: ABC transporter ATP-binding protein/permease [Vallitalea sp.]|jgi:ATP-binding cassette subfamily B protein|nr:ABC transporter ATP-binding protein/permease [Vallitalea sp.]